MQIIKPTAAILALAFTSSAIAATSPTLAVAHEAWRLEQNCGLARGNVIDAEADDQEIRNAWIKNHVPAGKKAVIVGCEIEPGNVVYSASWRLQVTAKCANESLNICQIAGASIESICMKSAPRS